MSYLTLRELSFSYAASSSDQAILSNFNLELKKGEIHCLLGPSGCGKSTLLHLIAGFFKTPAGANHFR